MQSPHRVCLSLVLVSSIGAAGVHLRAQPQVDPCDVGVWEAPFNHGGSPAVLPACGTSWIPAWPTTFEAIHMVLIPKGAHQGHVMVWDYIDYVGRGTGQGEQRVIRYGIFDPRTRQFWNFMHCLVQDFGDLFCAGEAWNANGDLVIAGGTTSHAPHNSQLVWGGAKLLYVWEPPVTLGTGGTWHVSPTTFLDNERWYPTVLMLGPDPNNPLEDKMAVLGGTHNGQDVNSYQIWRHVPGIPTGAWESNGTTNTFPGPSFANGAPGLGDYPRPHYLSTHEFITAGFPAESGKIDHFTLPRVWTGPWTMSNRRIYGSSVLFPISPGGGMQNTIVAMAGLTGYLPGPGAILGDAQAWNPGFGGWVGLPPMLYPRWVLNTVLLADSSVVGVGGERTCRALRHSETPAYIPEVFKGGAWRSLAPGTIIRDYHSTALLTRQAKVVTGGGASRFYAPTPCGGNPIVGPLVADYQILSPPYLECGYVQPEIQGQFTALPNNYWTWSYGTLPLVTHGALRFGVSITKAVLMRVGAVTHHADPNQRCVELAMIIPPNPPNTVQVAVPTLASHLLPRGFYMLFLLTNQGTPSEAAFVRIQ